MTSVPQGLFLVFTVAVVLSLIIQAVLFILLMLGVLKTVRKLAAAVEEIKVHATPLMREGHEIVDDLKPKIKTISGRILEISEIAREQVSHVNETVGEVVDKSKTQAARVDDMVSAVLDGVTHAGETIRTGVRIPVRQVSAFLNGLAAAIDAFKRKPQPNPVPDSEHFV